MDDYEKLGAFYLGREYDLASGRTDRSPLLYDAKDLTTHAVIVGMTGSGKTGLGITLLEEAAIDNIPSIVIDPKGDLGNLLLTFPELKPEDFVPWIDPSEAVRHGQTVEDRARETAQTWKAGLAEWDQPVDRIQRLRDAAEVVLYTPGSDAGRPLTVLKSLDAPPQVIRDSFDALRERTSTTVSGLLTLLGINADPLRSTEHILLSNIIENAWKAGRNLDLAQLIREIQNPPFQQIGVMDLESIISTAERRALAMNVNNILASPAFASWTHGERLDIQKMLYAKDGRARVAVISVAHLSDQERMFFITILLNEFLSWMRTQPGTSSLRAVLYMDEVFGYLPPTANPPSKLPMLTLLKQARAYGVGLILATQNPVDLDYKALSNAGTWFLGRLQTERDKARMLDGLEGASASAGVKFDRQKTESIISGLKNRVFLLNNVHEDAPIVFQCRWALSYLRGPLTRDQIRRLTQDVDHNFGTEGDAPLARATAVAGPASSSEGPSTSPPIVPPDIPQRYVAVAARSGRQASVVYQPALLAQGRLHFVDAKSGIDQWQDVGLLVPLEHDSVSNDPWEDSEQTDLKRLKNSEPVNGSRYGYLPPECLRPSSYKKWLTSCKAYLYREQSLSLNTCPELGLLASPGETDGAFRARLSHAARERRDLEIEKLRVKNQAAITRQQEKLRKAEQRVEVEKQQANSATMSAAMTFGSSVLGALFGRKTMSAANAGRATSTFRAANRAAEQRSDIQRAKANQEAVEEELSKLEERLAEDLEKIKDRFSDDRLVVESRKISPRKSDLAVNEIALVWLPFTEDGGGGLIPAFDTELVKSGG